jgi:hypothetical protein
MLSEAKHLAFTCRRPFAALRVTYASRMWNLTGLPFRVKIQFNVLAVTG